MSSSLAVPPCTPRHEVAESIEHVHNGEEKYQELRKAHTGANEDEKTVEALDPGGKLRAENEAAAPASHEHGAADAGSGEEPAKH